MIAAVAPVRTGGSALRVAIIGAGVSGIVTARVLTDAGIEVTVFEQRADVGGVWSASRAYPGISTQDDRRSYAFSDMPFPDAGPAHPAGAEVREYLERYLRRHGLTDRVRLASTVLDARPTGSGWALEVAGPDGREESDFDWLVCANGVFSTPHVPDWPGRAQFEAAGGRVLSPGSLGDGGVLDGRRVVVVGWGKTACDLAVVAAARGRGAAVLARTLTWKYPKRIGLGPLTFRHLVLTRAGERLVAGAYRSSSGRIRVSRLPERVPRKLLGRLIADSVDRATGLSALGLRPDLDISASTGLVSDGFFEAVREGRLAVHRGASIESLGADDHGPFVRTAGGDRLGADVVLAATGFEQRLPFLPDALVHDAVDEHGALLLHQRVLALDVPRLAFIGWAHSYRSPLTSEIAAHWLAGLLQGRLPSPGPRERGSAARFRLSGRGLGSARVADLPGVSMRELDDQLRALGVRLPVRVRLRQLWAPVEPADYESVLAATLRPRARESVPSRA